MSTRTVDLDITGMTCASCVNHVSQSLNAIDGVEASVNLATERASVRAPDSVDTAELIRAVEAAGYQAREHGADTQSKPGVPASERLIGATILTLPVLAISMIPAWQFDYWQYLMFVLATPVVWWAGWPFHRAAWAGLRHGRSSMDTLVSVGTITAWGWSTWALAFGHAGMVGMRHEWSLLPQSSDASMNLYFETAAVLITIILLGRWLEERSRRTAGSALTALGTLLPAEVRVLEQAASNPGDLLAPTRSERLIARSALTIGQSVVVLPGERVPVDGVIVDGAAELDESMLSGESAPVFAGVGATVLAGALVLNARLVLRVERVGADTRIAQLTALVDQAQVQKSSVQRLADRISAVFVPVVLALAAGTGLAWWAGSANPGLALSIAIAVVIIACPCALGLATPVAIMAGTGRGAQLGIIISGPEAIENSGRLGAVFLDKTGTLTTGRLSMGTVHAAEPAQALAQLAGLERGSTHPIAAALARSGVEPAPVTNLQVEAGVGVRGQLAGQLLEAVSLAHAGDIPAELTPDPGVTAVALRCDGKVSAVIEFTDTLKPDARNAIIALRENGVTPVLLSGDRQQVVAAVAANLGIADAIAECSPEQKLQAIRLAQGTARVAMVGDGINDAAALAAADLGIAIGSGTDLARAASDITVLRDDASAIPQAIRLAQATRGIIRGNLVWAFGYNVLAIPMAMAGLLGPMIAGAAMAFSSVFVVLNSVRLTRFR